uniref:M23 family metallopeptidase n=1 Tax=Phascolarctobacterium succinatutens TaxID=626940 RepID=UPI0023F61F1A
IAVAAAVAKIQLAMLERRVRLQVMSFVNKVQAKQQELVERIQAKKRRVVGRMKARYHALSSTWRRNQHFTFCFIPADGQNIAKTHVKKTHLKYAMTAVASFLVFVSCTIGVLAHFAVQNEQQKQELAAYKQTKSEQEQTIRQLRLMAETNQKKLAALSKLEDQVRSQMEKSGAQLPPKSNASDYAGQGGPVLGSANPANIVLEQEKNIGLEADAKKVDLENLLSAIEAENYRREVTPSQWPTSGGYISSSFGGRANPFGGYGRDWHPGIDIATDYGEPVYASAAGYVQQAGWYGGYGIYARINHDYGYQTAYGHMSRVVCRAGQYVKKGEIIGYVGSTGYSTGPHLHFEVIHYGEQVDPSSLM